MLLVEKIKYEKFKKITNEDGSRKYLTPSGPLPSVTTILGATGDKTGLERWKKAIGEKEAEIVKKESTSLGSLMHLYLENYILGKNSSKGNNFIHMLAKSMADVIIKNGLQHISEIWAVEQELYYPGVYAGQVDFVGVYKDSNTLVIGDFKTTTKPKKEQYVLDYKLQLVAYAIAHNIVYNTDITQGIIFMASREKHYQEFRVSSDEFNHYLTLWVKRVEEYYNSL